MSNGMHPLDFDSLRHDSEITSEEIERIYNIKKADDPDSFRLVMMRLAQEIEAHREDLLCRVGRSIRIMTNLEADSHTFNVAKRAAKTIYRQTKRRVRIDRADFSPEEMRKAEARDTVLTSIAIANRKALAKAERAMLMDGTEDKKPDT